MRSVKRSVRPSARDVISVLAPPPDWIEPELCKLVKKIPDGEGWAHEIKFDGFRMHARVVAGAVVLLTRNGLDWTGKYPEIAAAIAALNCDQAYLDGELCAVLPDGSTSFSALQSHAEKPALLAYFAFDLLHLDGEDLSGSPLLERKARLETLLAGARSTIHYSSHIIGDGQRLFEKAGDRGLEGLVSKQINEPYRPGNRGVWVKTKLLNRQEFVVVGWTDPEGSRTSIGSLLLGYYRDDGRLIYAGRAGTGMSISELRALRKKLAPLAADAMPLAISPAKASHFSKPLLPMHTHWVRPELVAQVSYLTWTADGLLRHVVYEGLREDKAASEVRRMG